MTTTYQLSQYKTWVMNRLNDSAFDGSVLTQFANDTNRELCHLAEWPFMETTFDGTLTTGQMWYDLPDDYETGLDLSLILPTNQAILLRYVDYRYVDERYPNTGTQTRQMPWLWSSFGTDFFVGPYPPDQGYTLQLRYVVVPKTLGGDSDTFNIPDAFSEAVVLGMYRRALRYNDSFDLAGLVDGDFNQAVMTMKQRLIPRQTGESQSLNRNRKGRYWQDDWDA